MDKGLRRLVDAVAGARLCYGEPVRAGDLTVIPVSRVRAKAGWGTGRRKGETGGGGGGSVDAQPAGFIEVSAQGARFVEIADPDRTQRLIKTGAAALTTVLAGLAGAKRLRGARRPAGLLGRGR